MTVTWNTTATNLISNDGLASIANPALVAYVNMIAAGQPMNQYALTAVFQAAWVQATTLPIELLTTIEFEVSINGIDISPEMGTGIIAGDPESYFFMLSSGCVIVQG
jgi:hypothetical protein